MKPIERKQYVPKNYDHVELLTRNGMTLRGIVICHNPVTRVAGIRLDGSGEFHSCHASRIHTIPEAVPLTMRAVLVRWLRKHHLWPGKADATRSGVA